MAKNSNREKEIMKSLDMAEKRFREAQREVKRYAKNDPEKAMAIAVGIGAAIGAILTVELINLKNREEKL